MLYERINTDFCNPVQCINPYVMRLSGMAYPAAFPCNSCPLCLARRSRDWGNRIELESLSYSPENVCFCTLTYSPDAEKLILTESGLLSLKYEHIQLFMKRLRRRLNYKIRFFCCGEYGSLRGRPHYHLIIFGLHPTDYPLIKECWYYGIIDSQVAGVKSFSYVAKYLTKLDNIPNNTDQFPPFFRCSKGLGREFVKEVCRSYYRKDVCQQNIDGSVDIKPYMILNGRKIVIPSYCLKKLRKYFLSQDERTFLKDKYLTMMQKSFCDVVGTWFGLPLWKDERKAYVSEKYMAHHYARFMRSMTAKEKIQLKGYFDG